MIKDRDDLINFSSNLLGNSSSYVSSDGFDQAAIQTEQELRFPYPVSNDLQSFWMVERMRRHLLYILMIESAHKFQYNKLHLEHRFQNYIKLIEKCDKDFLEAANNFPDLFDTGTYNMFSFYLEPGFVYNSLVRLIPYR